ncbi:MULTISPECIES: hypothetical protein [Bacillaceae]|uniref:hypothetical protein n=1 Tax=Bacillaceae TaxID=186817 RepID=UPI0006FD4394|nr:hypothetical protein [Bacillus sp. FJAT-25509]KQL42212.1 hypothetical protein AN960_02930 [Bacillus sp. FJAT-25509]
MKKILTGKMSITQALFACAFSSIAITVLESYIHYSNRYIAGIVAGLITFFSFLLAFIIFKNEK